MKLLCLGMALALTSAAFSAATLTGPTGLATLPTAAVAPAGQLSAAVDFVNTGAEQYPMRVLYGAMENLEIGASFTPISASVNDEAWGLNAKYLTPITLLGFNWAGGVQFQKVNVTQATDRKLTQLYWTGTRSIMEGDDTMPALAGTLGLSFTMIDHVQDVDALRLFGGIQADFANKLVLAAELQTKDDDIESDTLWSLVARYPFTETITGQLGISNGIMTLGQSNGEIFAGVSYAFDVAP
jgi:hypothetical protein